MFSISIYAENLELPFSNDKSIKMKINISEHLEASAEGLTYGKNLAERDLFMKGSIFVKDNGAERLIASPELMFKHKKELVL